MKKYFPLVASIVFFASAHAQKHYNLLIGTYTNNCKSDGIYTYDFNAETADSKLKSQSDKVSNPSFLSVSPDQKMIYSVNESGKESTVSAFAYDAKSGKIVLVNKLSSEGADPCHIINDDTNVLVANYSGGSIAVFKKSDDGSLLKAKQVIQHRGKSTTKRQESPHVHQLQFSPDKQFVLANDLGTDRIYLYRYQPESENEILKFKDTIAIKTGSGPRHLTFSPNGKFIYLLQELDGTLTVFAYENAKLRRVQETTIVTKDFTGETSAADIHISPDGKFLYATNRGEANTIAVFAIDSNGKLTRKQSIPTQGKEPRNFVIDPTGKYVLVAHQYTNDVVIFERNAQTGMLTDTGKRIELCSPVCLVFVE
ncbi:lactonase family protein [Flavobacterium sp.]|uniref:lactonase family protein n=1 Tax=Flavobacterium sp. TaxID=239 RepID=UPI0039E4DBF2